jgi:hypothetical protein
MTPHRDTQKGKAAGTFILDRRFPAVGRIKRASGTTHLPTWRRLDEMLTGLHERGRVDLLRSIRDGELTPLEVWDAYRVNQLERLPRADALRPLAETMRAWISSLEVPTDVSAKHKESLETSRRYFSRHAPGATVSEIARILEELRGTLGKEHRRSFNLARSAALAFVRDTLKRSHPVWLEIAAVEPVKVKSTRRRRPLGPQDLRALFPHPESSEIDAIAWGMATSGMGAGEYWGRWNVREDRIHIEGTKRAGRVRDVPLVLRPAVPRMHRRTWEDKVREQTGRAIVAYDLRRTYAHWLEEAGIARTRRRMYLGHGARDVTDLYEGHEVRQFLAEDAAKLRRFLELSHERSHDMRVVKA